MNLIRHNNYLIGSKMDPYFDIKTLTETVLETLKHFCLIPGYPIYVLR